MITLLICSPVCKRTRFVLLGRSRQSTQDCSYRGKLKIIDYIYIYIFADWGWGLNGKIFRSRFTPQYHEPNISRKGRLDSVYSYFIIRPPLFRFLSFFLRFASLRAVHQTVSLKIPPFQNERVPPFIYDSKLNRSRYFTAKIFGVVPFHFKRKIDVTNVFSSINILNFIMIHNNCSILVICKILVFRIKMSEIEHRTDHMNS